jgi:dipeptidyl aminopeptidase/acylaminoacyl peptidase
VVFTSPEKQPLRPTAAINMQGDFNIHGFHWLEDERIVFDTTERTGEFDLPLLHDDLYLVGADGQGLRPVFNSGYVHLISQIRGDSEHILVSMGGEANRLTLDGGRSRVVGSPGIDRVSYFTTHKGEIAVATGTVPLAEGERNVIKYQSSAKLDYWRELDRIEDTVDGMRELEGLGFSADDKEFYFLSDEGGTTSGVFSVSLETGRKRLLFRDPRYDVGGVVLSRDMETPIGVSFGTQSNYFYFDEGSDEAKLRKELADLFPGERVVINSYSRDGTKGIAIVYSDRQPPRCYLIDLTQSEVRQVFPTEPWIDVKKAAVRQLVRFTARDGLPLEGFLTLPSGLSGKNLPLVVVPHGGPFNIQNSWGYDAEAQFLAYRGYAVLQVNYRGSAGYGREFLKSGFKQWGGKIQDDIIDATHWAITQGVADKERVCIYGASFGGYSALMAPLREPGLYKCAVGYAGVYDLPLLMVSQSYFSGFFHDTIGKFNADLDALSPASQADKLTIPVLLIHGKEDRTAPFEQFKKMRAALEAVGRPAETLVKEKEGHGFYKLENKVEVYDKIAAFLDRYIGKLPDGKEAAPKAAAAEQPVASPEH